MSWVPIEDKVAWAEAYRSAAARNIRILRLLFADV